MLGWFEPTFRVGSVCELSPDWLHARQISSLLLDVDCTLKRYRTDSAMPEVEHWLFEMAAAGVGMCLVSNGRQERIRRFADRYGLPFVAMAMKPLPLGCRRAVLAMGFAPPQTALVGDQLFTDMIAGRAAHLRTILVDPIHPEDEPWVTRTKRPLERWMVGKRDDGEPIHPPQKVNIIPAQ
ncbi:MAG: YqeG family HAD IIIA-type phosphatase [Planctomycetota bacterium]